MPLHDWGQTSGWEGVHLLWMAELLRYIKGQLPAGYRAYLGSGPAVAIGAPTARPYVAVRAHETIQGPGPGIGFPGGGLSSQPDIEIAVASLDPAPSLFVERNDRLVAAVELVSPRNKDRPVARTTYLGRYVGYLIEGVNLLLVDLHPRPSGFSFAERIAEELDIANQPAMPTPMAVSYRVGEPAATGGRLLALWRRPLLVGGPLAPLPLPLDVDEAVTVELESTYMRAAADAYLE